MLEPLDSNQNGNSRGEFKKALFLHTKYSFPRYLQTAQLFVGMFLVLNYTNKYGAGKICSLLFQCAISACLVPNLQTFHFFFHVIFDRKVLYLVSVFHQVNYLFLLTLLLRRLILFLL